MKMAMISARFPLLVADLAAPCTLIAAGALRLSVGNCSLVILFMTVFQRYTLPTRWFEPISDFIRACKD